MSQRTKVNAKSTIDGSITTNGTGDVSGSDVNSALTDLIDSALFIDDNFIDEDSFSTDSATKAPSQQSTKAYIAAQILSGTVNDTDLKHFFQNDFVHATNMVYAGFTASAAGSGAVAFTATTDTNYINTTEKCSGVVSAELGTTTTGYSYVFRGLFNLTNFAVTVRHRYAINTLSDGTDTYFTRLGISDLTNITSSPGDPTNGVYFKYSDGVNSGKWQAVCSAAGVSTTADTGVTATAGRMEVFSIAINEAGTSVVFKINGSTVATITTNIPASSVSLYSYVHAHKTAGTTNRKVFWDWYDELFTKASAR